MIHRWSVQRALVLGAHPDDEIGCAGLIAKLVSEGTEVDITTFSVCEDLNDKVALMREWRNAVDLLGIKNKELFDVPNRRFPEYRQEILSTLDEKRELDYDLVLVPASSDAHQDHSTVAQEAARLFKGVTLLGYELPQNTVRSSIWQCYVGLSEAVLEVKVLHAKLYESQSEERYMSEEFIRALAVLRGVQAGLHSAEAYEVVRWTW